MYHDECPIYYTYAGTRGHHSLLLQLWQHSEKSSLFMSLCDFFMINNLGLVVISSVLGNPHRP